MDDAVRDLERLTESYPNTTDQSIEDNIAEIYRNNKARALSNTSEDENEIGRLSAEAVQSQYEAAAKAVLQMGEEVQSRILKLEAALRECDRDIRLLTEVAAEIRSKGDLVYAQIEEASALSKNLRGTAEHFRTQVKAS